jgi:pimeloyl-ACP methyl ester carboxylesterase
VDVLRNNSVKVPTLIVNGGDDALFPFPDGPAERSLFVGNRDVTQVTVPQTGHAVTFGRTAPQFRRTVGDWLKGHGY